jgi:monovalent cation:proton antiporter-2 (CPA2) family protein
MYGEGFFFQAFIYLAAAVVSVPIAKRLGLGSVLGYLIAGFAIGPFGLQLVGEEGENVMHFAEFGVVMMLFLVGLELQPSRLWRLRGPIMGMGGLQLALTTAIIMAIGVVLGLPWQSALAVGLVLALSSTAIVLQTLNEKGLLKTDAGQSSFAVLLFQDIAVIPLLALLPLLAVPGASGRAMPPTGTSGHGSTWIESLPGWAQTLVVLGSVVGFILAGRFLVRPLFRAIAQTRLRELFTAAALLLVIGIALLMTRVGLSPALGTFLAGVVLADSEYRHELEADIDPFKGLLLGLFFIAVGASIDFRLVLSEPLLIGGLVCALVSVKFIVLFILGRFFKMGFDQNLLLAFSLAQGGEFGFVLFTFAFTDGILPHEVTAPLIAVVAISMSVTPLLMLLNEKLIQPRFGTRESAGREQDSIDEENPIIIAGFGRFGNIVGRLLRANGVRATVLDFDSDNVEVLRKLGMKVFYGDATRHELLHSAGAENAKLLVLALDDPEGNLEMLQIARKHFPHLTILARANGRSDAYEMIEAGVNFVYRETFDASLRLGIEALRLLGFPSYQAHRASKTFRRHDEHALRELATMRHDRKAYISHARQRISDLEEILLEEMEPGTDQERDIGWDTTSLRQEFGSRGKK